MQYRNLYDIFYLLIRLVHFTCIFPPSLPAFRFNGKMYAMGDMLGI